MGQKGSQGMPEEASPVRSLAEVVSRVAAMPPVPVLFDALETQLGHVCTVLRGDSAGVYLVEGGSRQPLLRLHAQHGLAANEEQPAAVAALNGSLIGQAMAQQQPLLYRRGESPSATGSPWETSHNEFAVAPLMVDGQSVGGLWCASREGTVSGDLALLRLLAAQFTEMIRDAYLLQALEVERREHKQVAAHLRDPIWTISLQPKLRTVLVSDTIQDLTGYAAGEFIDRPELWLEMVYPDDRPIVLRDIDQVEDGRLTEVHHRVRIMRKDGEMRWMHTRARMVRADGEVRLYGCSNDVTDHVRLEEKVRRADRLSAVGMLAGGIAHEYNNLHFAILGTLDLLLMREDLQADVRQQVTRVREAAERASDITTKLVAFARGGSGEREVLDVAELVESTLGLVQKEFSTTGIDMQVKQSPLPLRIEGHRGDLGQVLVSLVINAQQAMQDRITKRLTVTTGLAADGRVFISVADTGHGVAPENMPRLFDPFFTTKGAAGSWLEERAAADAFLPGRGLGLSVAQTIVHEHGGDIEVESEVDCGTKFTVYLPALSLTETHVAEDATAPHATTGRILIADDEQAVREVCAELLEQLGYDIAEAAGGVEALRLLDQEDFDLVLVDLQMPDMEGLELVRRINNIPSERRPAKLIITGNIDDLPPETCADLGIAGLLQKRASLSELVSKVQLALATRQ